MRQRSRWWLGWPRCTLALAALTAAGCGGDDSGEQRPGAATALQTLGKGEGQVNLIAWAGYVEDGSTDPKVDWVTRLREADRLPGERRRSATPRTRWSR